MTFIDQLVKKLRFKFFLTFVSCFFCSVSFASPLYIVDTGSPPEKSISIALIPPSAFIFGPNGIEMNGQTVAVQFNLNDDYTIKDVESYFSVFQSGYLRVSLFESFNGQPSNNLYSKNIYVENDGWQGLGDIGLDLAPSKYWVVFDYDPLDYQSRFRGGLNIFYEGDDVITKVKSDFPKYYQEGLQTSAGLIVSVNEISSVPLPSGLALFASGLSFLLIPLRKKFVK